MAQGRKRRDFSTLMGKKGRARELYGKKGESLAQKGKRSFWFKRGKSETSSKKNSPKKLPPHKFKPLSASSPLAQPDPYPYPNLNTKRRSKKGRAQRKQKTQKRDRVTKSLQEKITTGFSVIQKQVHKLERSEDVLLQHKKILVKSQSRKKNRISQRKHLSCVEGNIARTQSE